MKKGSFSGPFFLLLSCRHLMKCVDTGSSLWGSPYFSFPSAMLFMRNDMLRARVRIVCSPSSSLRASPGTSPWIWFQYWLDATGIPLMVKYLFSWSKVAEQPPLLATATEAPTFIVLSNRVPWNMRSRSEISVPFAEA